MFGYQLCAGCGYVVNPDTDPLQHPCPPDAKRYNLTDAQFRQWYDAPNQWERVKLALIVAEAGPVPPAVEHRDATPEPAQ